MNDHTTILLTALFIFVPALAGWMWWQRRKEEQRVEAERAAAEARREAKRRDDAAQARYDSARLAAGLSMENRLATRARRPRPPADRAPSPAAYDHDLPLSLSGLYSHRTESAPEPDRFVSGGGGDFGGGGASSSWGDSSSSCCSSSSSSDSGSSSSDSSSSCSSD